jgi:hypothetical protein
MWQVLIVLPITCFQTSSGYLLILTSIPPSASWQEVSQSCTLNCFLSLCISTLNTDSFNPPNTLIVSVNKVSQKVRKRPRYSEISFPWNRKPNTVWPQAVLTAFFLTNFNAHLSQHSSLLFSPSFFCSFSATRLPWFYKTLVIVHLYQLLHYS